MPLYRIRPGHSFRLPDGSVQTGGAVIELGTDVAAVHPSAVELIDETHPAPVEAPAAPA